MIVLTDSAVKAVRQAIEQAEAKAAGLRIQVDAGGCAGYQYKMGLVGEPDPDDVIVGKDGVNVYVDPISQPLIQGTTIDFVVALEGSGFTFDNPNATNSCSCGKSFG